MLIDLFKVDMNPSNQNKKFLDMEHIQKKNSDLARLIQAHPSLCRDTDLAHLMEHSVGFVDYANEARDKNRNETIQLLCCQKSLDLKSAQQLSAINLFGGDLENPVAHQCSECHDFLKKLNLEQIYSTEIPE